jgi:hypothetical protein
MKYFIVALFFLCSPVGCVKRDSIRYVSLPAKSVEQVVLLPGPPDKPFKVVGHVFIDGANSRSWQSIAEAARAEAADIEADAVFMGQMGEYQAGSVSLPTGSTTTTTGTLNRSALRLNSQTFAGPTVAAGIERKQLSGTAIVFENRP